MYVHEWMSPPGPVIPPGARLQQAVDLMEREGVWRLLVVDRNRLHGIVSHKYVVAVLGWLRPSRRGSHLAVADVMSTGAPTVRVTDTVESAAQAMLSQGVTLLPVLEDGRLSGQMTEADLLRALCSVMGIGERGVRVETTVKDEADLLSEIDRYRRGVVVRSLVAHHDARTGRWNVVLRLRGRRAAAAPGA